jgi:hypothetical protein
MQTLNDKNRWLLNPGFVGVCTRMDSWSKIKGWMICRADSWVDGWMEGWAEGKIRLDAWR